MNTQDLEGEHSLVTLLEGHVESTPIVRQDVKTQIEFAQDKQKEMYDKHVQKENHFHIGQKVLYYNTSQEGCHTGKLQPKWKGPYYIHEIGLHGAYRLRTIDG